MSVVNAAGSLFAIAATYGATVSVTAATNANPCVVTAAGHTAIVGDYVEIVSGASWQSLERRVFRVSVVAVNDITLESLDTSSTTIYPAAGFVGATLRKIATWTSMSQIVPELDWTGGDLNTADATFLEHTVTKVVPVSRAGVQLGISYFFDPALAWLGTVRTASIANEYRTVRMTTPSSHKVLLCGLISLDETPKIVDSTLRGRVDVLGQAIPTVYAT